MNDTYVECLVAKKKNPLLGVLKYTCYGLAIICFFLIFGGSWLFFLLAAGFAMLGYLVIPMFDIEWEYLYISKEISVDKVMAKERRKHVMTLDLNKMNVMAVSNSHELDSYRARPHKDIDFSSDMGDAKTYTIAYEDTDGLKLIVIEPNEEMLKAIKTVYPRKVVEY